jgi:hypothetical protein
MSQGMPAARIIGPEKPQASASSFETVAMSTLRCLKMRLSATRLIASSNRRGTRLSSQSPISASCFSGTSSRTPPGRKIIGVHARAGGPLVEVHAVFAQLEQPQVRRHRADVHHMAAEVQHVVRDAGQLGVEDAQILGAQRHFEPEQFLDGEHEAVLHAHRRAIIEPVEIGQRLEIGLVLAELLGAAMEQADMGIDPLDDLAVELEHEPEHAVRGRMLRPEVDRVVGDLAVRRVGAGQLGLGLDLVGDAAGILSHGTDLHESFRRRPEPMNTALCELVSIRVRGFRPSPE